MLPREPPPPPQLRDLNYGTIIPQKVKFPMKNGGNLVEKYRRLIINYQHLRISGITISEFECSI